MKKDNSIFNNAHCGDCFITKEGKYVYIQTIDSETATIFDNDCIWRVSVKNGRVDDEIESPRFDILRRIPLDERLDNLQTAYDGLHMRYLSQVGMYQSLYEEEKKKVVELQKEIEKLKKK